jgi:hypothetical protein
MILGSKFSIILLVYMEHQLLSHTWLPPIVERIQAKIGKKK